MEIEPSMQYRTALVNVAGGLTYGYAIGLTSLLVFFNQQHAGSSTTSRDFWTPLEVGVFVAAMTVGGLVGSTMASRSTRSSRRSDITRYGVVFILGTLLTLLMWNSESPPNFIFLCFSRWLVGVGVGAICVLCPLFVGENTVADKASMYGALFQVFITLGIFIASCVGWVLAGGGGKTALLVSLFLACLVPLSICFQVETKPLEEAVLQDATNVTSSFTVLLTTFMSNQTFQRAVTASLVLSFAQRLAGVNAVMNYAPQMTSAMGFSPLGGNACIMFWNFATTLLSLPLASKVSPKKLFLGGLLGTSLASFTTFGGMTVQASNPVVSTALVGSGMAALIMAFECGMAPMFFVLATEVFPQNFREIGCSFVNATSFVFNLLVLFLYPLVVAKWSPSQQEEPVGTSRAFLAFGVVGITSCLLLKKLL